QPPASLRLALHPDASWHMIVTSPSFPGIEARAVRPGLPPRKLMSSQNVSDFTWTDAYLVGFPPMDATHQEFVELVEALIHAPDDKVQERLDAVAKHAVEPFEPETTWTEETDLPARARHTDEHAAVLRSVEQVQERVAQGDYELGRDIARELARWFPGHTDHLDSALSHWMCKRKIGGKPVVIRRDIRPGKIGDLA